MLFMYIYAYYYEPFDKINILTLPFLYYFNMNMCKRITSQKTTFPTKSVFFKSAKDMGIAKCLRLGRGQNLPFTY